jgi:transcriptional regulator with XRE-family HTH domain
MDLKNDEILRMVGEGIQFLRRKAGMTQQELGELVGLNPNYISAIERGQRNVTIITLQKIGQGLGINIDEMLYICCRHGYKQKPFNDTNPDLDQSSAQAIMSSFFSMSPEEKQILILLRNINSREIKNGLKMLLLGLAKTNKANPPEERVSRE